MHKLFSISASIFLNNQKICSLAENTSSKIVFNEVLAAAGRDIVSKDISRLRGGWPMQDAFYVSPNKFETYLIIVFCDKSCIICLVNCLGVNNRISSDN